MKYVIDAYAIIVTLLIAATLVFALPRYFMTAMGRHFQTPRPRRLFPIRVFQNTGKQTPFWRVCLLVFLAFSVSRACIWAVGYVGSLLTDDLPAFWGRQQYLFYQWDADHYLGIARNGYVTEGDARLHLVFYPLYPFLIRLLTPLFAGNTLLCAVVFSNVCLLGAGFVLFRLTELGCSARRARWAVWLFMFCPAGMFFSIAYTESLFFLLTLLSVYLARRRRFALAIFCGSLSALTRLPGVVCAVPIFFEMLRAQREKGLKPTVRNTARAFFLSAIVLSGFGVYLLINYLVSGDPFRFLYYQRTHWGQQAGNILSTARYTLFYAIDPNVEWYRWGVWIPQTAALILTALAMFFSRKRAHPGDLAYAVVYFAVTISPTMLLSGTRYLCAMYPLYPMLAGFCRHRRLRWLVLPLYGAFFLYCAWMFMGKTILL